MQVKQRLKLFSAFNIKSISIGLIVCIQSSMTFAVKPVVTGSKIDTESILLCQIVNLALQNKGITIKDKCGTGVTQVVRNALLEGEIDLYPEYTGNAQYIIKDFKINSQDPEVVYKSIVAADLAQNKIAWLRPAPANNTFVIAVTKQFSQQHQVRSVADFARYINAGKPTKLIASYEFVSRSDGLKAFERQYGFKLKQSQLIMIPGGNTAQTETALVRGANNINAAMAYSTDGQLAALNLIGLSDSKGAQEVYQPAITIRDEVLQQNPEIKNILEPIFAKLSTEKLSQLNGKIVVQGLNPAWVAKHYLKEMSIIK